MSVLRSIESKLESLFEGVFGRAFRTNVQPVELARKLVKEMDDHRNVSVSRVYVPNEYTIYLSPSDREQFASYEDAAARRARRLPRRARAARELRAADAAARQARDRRRPRRRRLRDRDADGADRRRSAPASPQRRRRAERDDGLQAGRGAVPQPTEAASPVDLGIQREIAVLSWDGERHEISKRRGRDRPLEGRRHPGRRPERLAPARRGAPGGRAPTGSSTSTRRTASRCDGKRVKRLKLEDGTRFTVGSTEIAFSRELQ